MTCDFLISAILRKVRESKQKVANNSKLQPSGSNEKKEDLSPAANPAAGPHISSPIRDAEYMRAEYLKVVDVSEDDLNTEPTSGDDAKPEKKEGKFHSPLKKLSLKRRTDKQEGGVSKPLTNGTPLGVGLSPEKAHERALRRGRREDLRFTTTLFVVVAVFVVSWLPFCITMFINVFSPHPVPRIPDIATLLLGCLNSSCNPIIYGVMNKRFRNGYRRLFCYCCFRCRRGSSEENYTQTARQSWRNNLQ